MEDLNELALIGFFIIMIIGIAVAVVLNIISVLKILACILAVVLFVLVCYWICVAVAWLFLKLF
ncbi:hypothetical protein_gp239 [Bacillus phage vB_BceM_WH1]|nr:hypothetical protein_gp239 [Bacillus phage vB_BceM_WH1]